MVFELIRLGTDITRVRKQVRFFIELMQTDEAKAEMANKMFIASQKSPRLSQKYSKYLDGTGGMNLSQYAQIFLERYIIPLYTEIEKMEFVVHPRTCYAYEFVFLHENVDNDEVNYDSDTVLDQLNKKIEIQEFLLDKATSNVEYKNDEYADNLRKMWGNQISLSNPDFDFFFALTLRQTSAERINDFLEFQQGFWDEKEKFVTFLKSVLVGQKKFIPKQNRIVARQWVNENTSKALNNPQELTIQTVNITSEKVLIKKSSNGTSNSDSSEVNIGFSNDAFRQPPFEVRQINGRLAPQIVRRFLSFLWEEGFWVIPESNSDEQNQKKYFLDYGFVIPSQKLATRFHLNLGGRRTKKIIYHCFHLFFNRYALSGSKEDTATFLLHTFDNFDHISIHNLVGHLRDYGLTVKDLKFDLNYYFGETDTKKT